MKNKGLICVIMVLVMCFCVSCKKTNNKDTNGEVALNYSQVSIPNPITLSDSNMTTENSSAPKLYTSTLSGKTIISGYNVKDYGAVADGKKDDSGALLAAMNAASAAGGGTVYMPAGKYYFAKQIVIPSGVTLAGEWLPATSNGFENGTTILVGVGKNNASVLTSDAFIKIGAGAKLTMVNIYYPEQNASAPIAYPYTIANGEYLGYTVDSVNLINSYRGIAVAIHNVVMLNNIYVSAIKEGFYSDAIYDIPRYSNITVSADIWSKYETATSGNNSETDIKTAVSKSTGFRFGKIDWAYLYNVNIFDVKIGIRFENSENAIGAFNGQFNKINIANVEYGFSVAELATVGAIVSESSIEADISAVITEKAFKYPAQIFFNKTEFKSGEVTVNNVGDGALLFTNCTFKDWGECVFDNATMGYINADSCVFEKDDSLIAHIGSSVVGSIFINGKYKAYPTLYNESLNEGVYVDDLKVNEPIAPIANNQTYNREYRTATKQDIYFAADFGAVADGNMIDCKNATDNTNALQQALNCAGKNGGGIVFVGAGTYYVKDYLVIPEGVELKGVSDNNRHFGINTKGTTFVTGNGKNTEFVNPFISLKNKAGLSGVNIFYIDQHYSKNVVYSPTVFVGGDECYVYNVTIPDAYVGVLVKGKKVHIDYLRALGLKACLVLEGADEAFVENITLSGGDWQDGARESINNAPPADHWTNFPNYYNEGIYISNSNKVVLLECFTFGMGHGLHLDGEVNNLLTIGLGVDASKNAVYLENSGENNVLINNQLVGSANYVTSSSKYTGKTCIYGTSCWYGSMDVRCTFDGTGSVYMQQCKIANGGVDVNTAKVYLQNFVFDLNTYEMLILAENAEGYLINSAGTINVLKIEGESSKFKTANLGKR